MRIRRFSWVIVLAAMLAFADAWLYGANEFDQVASAYAIAQIDPSQMKESVAKLSDGLLTSQRVLAASCLGNLGPAAKESATALEAALDDSDSRCRKEVRVALQKVTGQSYPENNR